MTVGVVIPYRGTGTSKSRLRESMDKETVQQILYKMTQQVISEVMKIETSVNLYILTKESDIRFKGKFQVFKDKGSNLNESVKQFTCEIEEDIIMVLMADLPLIKHTHIESILNSVKKKKDVVVAPAGDNGTSVLCFKRTINIPFFYGEKSAIKFSKYMKESGINSLILKKEHCYQDIDTLKDLIDLNQNNFLPKWLKGYLKEVLLCKKK